MGVQRGQRGKDERPGDLLATSFRYGSEEYVVLSFPIPESGRWSALTAAERAVARMLVSGMSNQQIAGARGRSIRTVANQVAAIFHKLGVRSRGELGAVAGSSR